MFGEQRGMRTVFLGCENKKLESYKEEMERIRSCTVCNSEIAESGSYGELGYIVRTKFDERSVCAMNSPSCARIALAKLMPYSDGSGKRVGKQRRTLMRKTNPNRCPKCGKSIPFTLPPYMRIEKGKDGIWRPMDYNICKCDPKMYKFCVLDLCDKKNLGNEKRI